MASAYLASSRKNLRLPYFSGSLILRSISNLVQGKDSLRVEWKKPESVHSQYLYTWLRDNCKCSECYNFDTNQHFNESIKIFKGIKPASVALSGSKNLLEIVWADGHKSKYTADWLKQNAYDGSIEDGKDERIPYLGEERVKPQSWGKEIASNPPTMLYQSIIDSEENFIEWNDKIEKYGFCIISNIPCKLESMKLLIERIGLVRNTLWGDYCHFGTTNKSKDSSIAQNDATVSSQGVDLVPHADGSYTLEAPALLYMQPLSFLGPRLPISTLIDGLKISEVIREHNYYHFQILSTVPIPYQYVDNQRKYLSSHPHFKLEPDTRRFLQICYNSSRRMTLNKHCMYKLRQIDAKADMSDLYAALSTLDDTVYNEELQYRFQLKPGTALMLDNHRMLHARSAFKGIRKMQSAWVSLEDWRGKVAAAKDKLKLK